MTKKTGSSGAGTKTATPPEAVFTAHQVHTLAQLMFQRLTGHWAGPVGWSQNGQVDGASAAVPGPSGPWGWSAGPQGRAIPPTPNPPVVYWYP